MSHSYFTRKLLNIKDKNITFQEDYLEEVKFNGITSFIFKGILSYQPTHCQKYGTLFDSKFKKHGFKTSRIVIPKVSLHDTYLELKNSRISEEKLFDEFWNFRENVWFDLPKDLTKNRHLAMG